MLLFFISTGAAERILTPEPTRIPIIPLVIGPDQLAAPGQATYSGLSTGWYDDTYPEPQGSSSTPLFVPGFLLVRFDMKGLSGQSAEIRTQTINAGIGAEMVRDYSSVGIVGLQLVSLPDTTPVMQAIDYYSNIPGVLYAEPDYILTSDRIPDDPDFWRQYSLLNTGSPFKEDLPPGKAGADIAALGGWMKTTSSNDVIIAVIDTGIDVGHPDLVDNLWVSSDPHNPLHGFNTIYGDGYEPWDDDGHGTHCAGIIGMVGNNGIGGTGVAWNTSIMGIKSLNSMGGGKLSDIVFGMAYASALKVPVISCSLGISIDESHRPRAMEDVILASESLFVCSAGNNALDTSIFPQYPGCYKAPNLITVASTDADDNLSNFSNWGNQTVHVAAPGSDIYSTLPSHYSWNYIWQDIDFSPDNLTLIGNWTYEYPESAKNRTVLHGYLTGEDINSSLVIEMKHPVVATKDHPEISYDVVGVMAGNMKVEYSFDGFNWAVQQDTLGEREFDTITQQFCMLTSVGEGQEFYVRLSFMTPDGLIDLSLTNLGIGYRAQGPDSRFGYMSGTSMSTPMVSGIAGLIMGVNPHFTAPEIKGRIMEAVDPLPSLSDKIATGGRVNLTAALTPAAYDFIPVQAGWNHVSVPFALKSGFDTAQIFAGVNSSGHSVLKYVDDLTGWTALTSSDSIVPLQGYWVFSDNYIAVPIRFESPVFGSSRSIAAGWTSIGGWNNVDISANETLNTLGNIWSYLFGYDAQTQRYDEVIIRGGSGNQSDSRPVIPYRGYWLYCFANGTYEIPLH